MKPCGVSPDVCGDQADSRGREDRRSPVRRSRVRRSPVPRWSAVLAIALSLGCAVRGGAQASPAEVGGREMLTVGGTLSAYRLSYGERLLLGAGIYVDSDYDQHYGIEAEGRWLWLRQRDGVRDATYLIGFRYSFNGFGNRPGGDVEDHRKKFRPYAKILVGVADFQYPYGYASGKYFAMAPGGGVDYRINHLIRLRLIDAEYQVWPQFAYGPHSSFGISSGLRFRVF